MQHRAAHTHPVAGPERRLHPAVRIEVADTPKLPALQRDTEALQLAHGVRHQALAAGLVDGAGASLHDGDVQAGARRVQGGDQTRRAAACHQEVDHVRLANALFSVAIRVRSSAALRIVKTSAVIHALCTSGSATPSATTAT